jgi:hypothetical protein
MTFQLTSDVTAASVGAVNYYGDSAGTLVTTAVLIRSPANLAGDPVNWKYRPIRVDLLLFTKALQATRAGISDFLVTLYADDDTPEHNPSIQVSDGI